MAKLGRPSKKNIKIETDPDKLSSVEPEKKTEEVVEAPSVPEVQEWVKRKSAQQEQEAKDRIEKAKKTAARENQKNEEAAKVDQRWKELTKTGIGGVIEWRRAVSGMLNGFVGGQPIFSIKQGGYQYSLYSESLELTKKLKNKYIGVELTIEKLKARAEGVLKENGMVPTKKK